MTEDLGLGAGKSGYKLNTHCDDYCSPSISMLDRDLGRIYSKICHSVALFVIAHCMKSKWRATSLLLLGSPVSLHPVPSCLGQLLIIILSCLGLLLIIMSSLLLRSLVTAPGRGLVNKD